MKLGKIQTIIRDYLNKYVNWRTRMFWLIVLVSVVGIPSLCAFFNFIDKKLFWDGSDYPWSRLPFITAIIGSTFSIVYLFWRERLLQAMFVTKILWIPEGNDWISWYLWTTIVISAFFFLFFWIKNIFYYGIGGIVRIIYYTVLALVSFTGAIFIGVALAVITIIMLLLTPFSGESSTNSRIPLSVRGPSEAELNAEWWRRREQIEDGERRSLLADLKEKMWWKNAKMD